MLCGRVGCGETAVAVLLIAPQAREAWVVGADHPAAPEGAALCAVHADRVSVPSGWSLHQDRPSPSKRKPRKRKARTTKPAHARDGVDETPAPAPSSTDDLVDRLRSAASVGTPASDPPSDPARGVEGDGTGGNGTPPGADAPAPADTAPGEATPAAVSPRVALEPDPADDAPPADEGSEVIARTEVTEIVEVVEVTHVTEILGVTRSATTAEDDAEGPGGVSAAGERNDRPDVADATPDAPAAGSSSPPAAAGGRRPGRAGRSRDTTNEPPSAPVADDPTVQLPVVATGRPADLPVDVARVAAEVGGNTRRLSVVPGDDDPDKTFVVEDDGQTALWPEPPPAEHEPSDATPLLKRAFRVVRED